MKAIRHVEKHEGTRTLACHTVFSLSRLLRWNDNLLIGSRKRSASERCAARIDLVRTRGTIRPSSIKPQEQLHDLSFVLCGRGFHSLNASKLLMLASGIHTRLKRGSPLIVGLTAYNRPEYFREVLESYSHAISYCKEPVFVVVSVDYSDKQQEILDLIPNERGFYWFAQDKNLGLQKNTLSALDAAWDLAKRFDQDFVLFGEDDLVLAPDALRMACWMRDTYRKTEDTGFISLTNVHNDEPSNWAGAYRAPWFECHAWGTWRSPWDWLRENWPHEWDDHWAARVNELEMFGLLQAIPNLSRSKSIGEFGVHSNTDYHAQHNPKHYAGDHPCVVYQGDYEAEFNVPVRVS